MAHDPPRLHLSSYPESSPRAQGFLGVFLSLILFGVYSRMREGDCGVSSHSQIRRRWRPLRAWIVAKEPIHTNEAIGTLLPLANNSSLSSCVGSLE